MGTMRPKPGHLFYITPHIHDLNFLEPLERERSLIELLALLDGGVPRGRVRIGYTIRFLLLGLYKRSHQGWEIDLSSVETALEVAKRVGRPFVAYLACNHFGDTPQSELESELLQDPINLMQYPDGSPANGKYFGERTLPFTLSTNPNIPVNAFRFESMRATVRQLNDFNLKNPGLLIGVTLNGEAHHLYEDIRQGTGRFDEIRATDYSPLAQSEFKSYLKNQEAFIRTYLPGNIGMDSLCAPSRGEHRQSVADTESLGSQSIRILGWAHHPDGIEVVEIAVGSLVVTRAHMSIPRPDVQRSFSEASSLCGFEAAVDVAFLPSGTHTLEVLATLRSGKRLLLAERSVRIENDFIKGQGKTQKSSEHTIDSQLHGLLELPANDVRISITEPWVSFSSEAVLELWDTYARGIIPIFGWAYHAVGVSQVDLYVDGRHRGCALYGTNRMDVYNSIAEIRSPNVGFRIDLNFSDIPTGIYDLKIVVTLTDARKVLLAERELKVVNHYRPPEVRDACFDVLPLLQPTAAELLGSLDTPASGFRVLFNPVARLWQDFRTHQVSAYTEHLQQLALAEGINPDLLFGYQLMPWLFGGWNDLLFSVGPECFHMKNGCPGVTLYGGLTLSPLPIQLMNSERYGVPEFNPMMEKNPEAAEEALRFQMDHGAVFVSPYFMCFPRHRSGLSAIEHGMFLIDPGAPTQAGRQFFEAIKALVRRYEA